MPRLSVPLTPQQHTAIKVKAAQVGLAQAEVARRLLFAWEEGEIVLPGEFQDDRLESMTKSIIRTMKMRDMDSRARREREER